MCTCSSSPTLNSRRAALSLALFQSHHLSSFPVEERPEALLPQFRIEVGDQSVRSRHMRQGTASWEWRAQEDSRSFPQGRRRDRGATPSAPRHPLCAQVPASEVSSPVPSRTFRLLQWKIFVPSVPLHCFWARFPLTSFPSQSPSSPPQWLTGPFISEAAVAEGC